MSFEVSRNGYFMYKPSWQQSPGARMKAANRAASDAYYENFSTLGSNLLTTMTNQTSSMMDITTRIVKERLQDQYAKKLEQAQAGLDVII